MKRRTIKRITIIFAVLGLLTLIWFWLAPSKAVNFVLPDFNELSYVNAKINSDTAYIEVKGVLENKAPYKININSLVYNLELAGVTLISEQQKLNLEMPSRTKNTVILIFRVPISKTRSLIEKLQIKDSTQIIANFDVTYNTLFGKTTISFSKDFDINVPNPPEIKLIKVKSGELNLKQKNVDIDLAISIKNNSEKIELRLNDLVYDAKIGSNIAGKGKYNKLIIIKPLSTIYLTLPINVKVGKPLTTFWKIAAKKEFMLYEINMHAILVNDSLQDVPISVNAKGSTQLMK